MIVAVKDLVFEYPQKQALRNLSFQIEQGSITALVGPNGSGKSTLLRCICGLETPLSGTVIVAGIDVNRDPRRAHQVLGYLSDASGLHSDLTAAQCLIYAAGLHRIIGDACETAMARVVRLLGLEPYLDVKAASLSRGWRQRLGIAQAMIHSPSLLLLDEPASGLDPEARVALSAVFKQIQSEGMTVIVSSHILAELEDYCTEMIVLRDGILIDHRANDASSAHRMIHMTLLDDVKETAAVLNTDPRVSNVIWKTREVVFSFSGDDLAQSALLRALVTRGIRISGFSERQTRLQDMYMSIGGTAS